MRKVFCRNFFSIVIVVAVLILLYSCRPVVVNLQVPVDNIVFPPVFSVEEGTYNSPITVELSSETESAEIYYTTDGSEPSEKSLLYETPIAISGDGTALTIKAVAVKQLMPASEVAAASYIIKYLKVESPELLLPEDGAIMDNGAAVWNGEEWIWLDTVDWFFDWEDSEGAEYYNIYAAFDDDRESGTDSSEPIIDSISLNSEYSLSEYRQYYQESAVIWRVRAFRDGLYSSWSEERTFNIEARSADIVATPVFSHASGDYYEDFEVAISCETEDADIYYTTNGSDPDLSSTKYTVPIPVSGTGTELTLKAAAYKDGLADSFIAEAEYSITDELMGYFKVANSWGVTGSWENIHDGFYRITYRAMKAQNIRAYLYADRENYSPTHIAVFSIDHDSRNSCKIYFGMGDPENPVIWKSFNSYEDFYTSSSYYSSFGYCPGGDVSFPGNRMVFDVSEFADYMGSEDFFMRITDESGDGIAGTVNELSLEQYSTYNYENPAPLYTVSAYGLPSGFSDGETVSIILPTAGFSGAAASRSAELTDSLIDSLGTARKMTASELSRMKSELGTAETGRNYNKRFGEFGTGLRPPSEDEWSAVYDSTRIIEPLTLDRAEAPKDVDSESPASIDWSSTMYFPPIGSQGSEGSCVAWSLAYYIKTFQEALDHERDVASAVSNGTYPSTKLNWIYSPDFLYHQINYGNDNGSSYMIGMMFLDKTGCASWEKMPYSSSDHTSWPNEAAWREAQPVRGQYLRDSVEYGMNYYIRVEDDDDIRLIQDLVAQGLLFSISIRRR